MRKQLSLILLVLFLDQALKVWIKTNLMLGEEIRIADWFIIHFTENNGMAFGMQFGGEWGKYALSIFRIIAIGGIVWYWKGLMQQKVKPGIILSITLILAGAIGNMIDSAFYGLLFSDSYGQLATVMEGGYAGFLQGRVVDMFYFPIINTYLPEWLPIWGGEHFTFFRPVFNLADAYISIGVINLLLFHRSFFK